MKQFKITVNGKTYDVAVEESNGVASAPAAAPVATPAAPASAAAPAPAAAPAAPAAPAATGAEKVNSPMPGNIIDIKVAAGDTVTNGQTLLILEAMKMENEIMAPKAGTVAAINTTKGAAVNTGDALVSIKDRKSVV